MKYKLLSIVIPIYNEESTLDSLLSKLVNLDLGIDKEIVLVNDCSKDSSQSIIDRFVELYPEIKALANEVNLGKTRTVKKGLASTTGDLVVIQDADLEYDPTELAKFVEVFQLDQADVVYGNRFGMNNKVIYWQNWIGNTFLSMLSALFTGLRSGMWTRDMEVCYKMANGEVFRDIGKTIVSTSGFGLEPELTAKFSKYKLSQKHLRFKQIPISYNPRTIQEGKHMHAVKDGIKALIEILKFNLT